MFIPTDSPTGHFTLLPMPREFFETPPPFGGGALLVPVSYTHLTLPTIYSV